MSMLALTVGLVGAVIVMVAVWSVVKRWVSRHPPDRSPVYVTNDAVKFAVGALDPEILGRLRPAGVRRILEWSIHYLQGLAVPAARRRGLRVVAGGEGNAIEYIEGQLAKRGHSYSPDDIAAVLACEAGYLATMGALGEPVREEGPV